MSIEVRRARREELERVNALRKMVNELHVEGRPDWFRPGFAPELRDHLYEQFDSDRFDVLVALVEGEVAGFATIEYVRRPEGPYTVALDYCHVHEIGVDEAFRRKGVATALVQAIRAAARAQRLPRVQLDVWAFNASAEAFYEAAGFKPYRIYMETRSDDPQQ